MSSNNRLVQQYRQSRKNQNDYPLTNMISAAADIIPNRQLLEALMRQYVERRYSHDNG